MDYKAAILFMPDDIALTNDKTPLMLQCVMFCPVLTWTCAELIGMGIERLFVVSDKNAHDLMKPHVPESAVFIDGAKHADELLELLDDMEGDVLVLNGVVLPVGVFSGGAVYAAKAEAVRNVLKEHGAFAAFPEGAEIQKGFLPVGDEEELRAAQPMCRQKVLQKHFDAGVDIMDANATYIDPRVRIGAGTVILPGTILRAAPSSARTAPSARTRCSPTAPSATTPRSTPRRRRRASSATTPTSARLPTCARTASSATT